MAKPSGSALLYPALYDRVQAMAAKTIEQPLDTPADELAEDVTKAVTR
jgi:hypothetical protein